MHISAKRMAILREHFHAESVHDMDALIAGMAKDCFNDVVGASEPFVGPTQTAERYRKHWKGFPDFTVRVRRILCADESCVVTENEWRGTHLGRSWGGRQLESQCECARSWSGTSRAMRCGARRSFSIMPPCSSRVVLRSKSRQPRVRWSRQRSRLSTHRFSATARHSNKFASRGRPLSARLAHCPEPRRPSLHRTDTGRSALVAGTGLHV